MLLKNKLSKALGIDYAIFQGGMAWVATAELAAAVSNAGGLGLIGAGAMPADLLQKEIQKVKKLTKKPYGVNVMLMSPFVKDVMKVVIEERVPVVTTGAGNPGEYIASLKEIDAKVIPVVPSVALAKRLEKQGVFAVVAEGHESGGHVGELTTMALVPQVVDAVKIPVIAAGGIADARGVVAAFALGACGVQIGSRFVVAKEALVHENYKEMVLKAKDRSTIVTGVSTGHPVRVLTNKFTRDYKKMEDDGLAVLELEKFGEGKLRLAVKDGDIDNGSVMIGQIAGMMNKVQTVQEIFDDITCNIDTILESMQKV